MRVLKDKYINPFTDFGFKKLFGTELNKDLLIDFLNELLKQESVQIVDLNYLNSEQLGRSKVDRKAIFDIYCETKSGEKIIVELQKAKQNYFKDRSVYYSTFPIQQQAERGDWNFELKAIYTVGILDFVFDEDKNDSEVFHHEVKLIDIKTNKVFLDKLTYVYLEMPKFNKTEGELTGHFEKWLYVLKNLNQLTDRPQRFQEKVFSKLFREAEISAYDEKEYAEYEESLKTYRDLKNSVDTAYDEGKVEGLAEGKAEGKTERSLEIARNMKQKGMPLRDIAEVTGLAVEDIEALWRQERFKNKP